MILTPPSPWRGTKPAFARSEDPRHRLPPSLILVPTWLQHKQYIEDGQSPRKLAGRPRRRAGER